MNTLTCSNRVCSWWHHEYLRDMFVHAIALNRIHRMAVACVVDISSALWSCFRWSHWSSYRLVSAHLWCMPDRFKICVHIHSPGRCLHHRVSGNLQLCFCHQSLMMLGCVNLSSLAYLCELNRHEVYNLRMERRTYSPMDCFESMHRTCCLQQVILLPATLLGIRGILVQQLCLGVLTF